MRGHADLGSSLRPNPEYDNLTIGVGHVGYGGSIPGMVVHRYTDGEFKEVGKYLQINYTRGGVVGNPQYGILVFAGHAGGNLGWRIPAGQPALNHGALCEINLDLINKSDHPQIQLDAAIAHEIGHAVGLWHHNERATMKDPKIPTSKIKMGPDKKWPSALMYPNDPSKDSCVMGGGNMDASVWLTNDYRNFHSPVPNGLVEVGPKMDQNWKPIDPKWEDHWPRYWLHDNHSHHKGY